MSGAGEFDNARSATTILLEPGERIAFPAPAPFATLEIRKGAGGRLKPFVDGRVLAGVSNITIEADCDRTIVKITMDGGEVRMVEE